MRLDNFLQSTEIEYRIDEAIQKSDITDALKSDKVLMGGEFEFISKDLEKHGLHQEIDDAYDRAYKSWKEYHVDLEKYRKVKKHIEGLLDKKQELLDKEENPKIRKVIYDKVKKLKKALKDTEAPLIPGDYADWYEIHIEDHIEDVEDPLSDDFGPDLPEPIDLRKRLTDFAIWKGVVEKIDFSGTPFKKNFVIKQAKVDPLTTGSKHWSIEPDADIDRFGIEIITPPMPVSEFVDAVQKMFKWIGKHGYTEKRTAFHVHVGLKGVSNLENVLDPIKLVLFFDEDFMWKAFPQRVDMDWVQSIKDKLKSSGNINKEDLFKIIDKKKVMKQLFDQHADAINLESWKEGHIEYRYMGGPDYYKKFNEVKAILGRYIYTLLLATDENFKRKDYILKLQRIMNKIEMFKLEIKLNKLLGYEKSPKVDKLIKKTTNDLDTLSKIYKLVKKTRSLINKNKSFLLSVNQQIKDELKGI